MPRQRKKTKTRIPPPGLTDGVREVLEEGFAAVLYEIEHGGLPPDAEILEWWKLYGERVTLDYAEAHPGSRPWGWWQWEAPEDPRRILGVEYTPFALAAGGKRPTSEWERKTLLDPEIGRKARGVCDLKKLGELVGEKIQPCTMPKIIEEPEHEYLSRHGLMNAGEIEVLERQVSLTPEASDE